MLFVDQWEELYTNCEKPERRERFIAELLEATARKDSPLQVVLTVRGDFYGEILQDRPLLDRIQNARLDLGPMKPEELRLAIEGPAHNVGLTFQDGLVDRILQEAGEEPGRLPLLEFALEELWKRRDRAELSHAGYEDLGRDPAQKDEGGPAAKTGCLSRAIATYAESVYGELEPDEQEALPALFRKLVRAGAKTEDDTRRRVPFSELDETARRVARKLADKRLLITTRSSGSGEQATEKESRANDRESDFVEVAHEQLLRSWGRLKQWINEDRQFLLWRSRIDLKVEEFARDGSSALLSGKSLHESKNFYPARQLDLEENQRGFLDASLTAERKRKRLIWGSVCLATVLAAAIGLVWHTYNQQQKATILVKTLVGTRAASVEPYLEQLEPYKEIAVPMLRDEFANADRSPSERSHAAYGLVRFDAAGTDEVAFLFDGVSTLANDEGENLMRVLATIHSRQPLNQLIEQRLDRANSAGDRARHAAVALRLGVTNGVGAVCELKEDPSSRTAFIRGFKEFPGDLTRVAQVLDTTEDRDVQSALCLAIGTLGVDAAEDTGAVLKRLFVEAPDGGTHSAAGWALRQQGLDWEELLKLAEPQSKPESDRDWMINSQGMTMIRLPAGEFDMGSKDDAEYAYDDEKPAHRVTLSKAFWLSDREVSVAQFMRFVEDADYTGPKLVDWQGYTERYSPSEQHPVQQVSWLDAVRYCNWLSRQEHLTPYYDEKEWQPVSGANGYRLPTEAEWENACRAGSTTSYCFGNAMELLDEYGVSRTSATAVSAGKLPNGWGLFDMHGNVYEWCGDWYGEYAAESVTDPRGLEQATYRVIRGGGWRFGAGSCRSAYRGGSGPEDRDPALGFRVAAVPPNQQAKNNDESAEQGT